MNSINTTNVSRVPVSSAPADVKPVAQPNVAPTPADAPSQMQLDQVVRKIQSALDRPDLKVGLAVDNNTDRLVILVTNPDSGELIKTIPSEEALARSERMEEMRNLLISDQA